MILEIIFWEVDLSKKRSNLPRCSVKKVLLKISQNSQENTCARVSFLSSGAEKCRFFEKLWERTKWMNPEAGRLPHVTPLKINLCIGIFQLSVAASYGCSAK